MNIAFNKLTKATQRIRVAKDVLKQIDAKKYISVTGHYIADIEFKTGDNQVGDIKKNFSKIKKCRVCALGACLLSLTHYKNKLSFSDVGARIGLLQNDKVRKLLSLFSKRQLLLIETAFEGLSYTADRVALHVFDYSYDSCSDDLVEKASEYFEKYSSSKYRLKAIMNNIIKNKGEFIP